MSWLFLLLLGAVDLNTRTPGPARAYHTSGQKSPQFRKLELSLPIAFPSVYVGVASPDSESYQPLHPKGHLGRMFELRFYEYLIKDLYASSGWRWLIR